MNTPVAAMRSSHSVRQQLWLGTGSLVLLLVLIAGGAIWQLRDMSAQMQSIVKGHGLRGELAHQLHAAQLKWMERLRALLVMTDAEDVKSQLAELESAERAYLAAESTLERSLSEPGVDASMGTALADIRKLREALSPVYAQASKSLQAGVNPTSVLGLLLPAEGIEARWRGLISSLVEQASRSVQTEFEEATRKQQLAVLLLAAVAAVAVCAALWMAASLVRGITRPINAAVGMAEAIAQGSLDQTIKIDRADEFGRLASAMLIMRDRLRETVTSLSSSTQVVLNASSEIRDGSEHLSARTEQAATSLAETVSAVSELRRSMAGGAEATQLASGLAESTQRDAGQGHAAVARLASQMESIETAAKRITEIVATIDGIAFQTNILALNASVEAAAAGQIRHLSTDTSALIKEGAASAEDVRAVVTRLVDAARGVAKTVQGVASGAGEQSDALGRIDDAVRRLDGNTQQNAALAEQLTAAAESLQQRAAGLQRVIGVFRIETTTQDASIELRAAVPDESAQ
jgi:methyl-accepting chemotaxis protein